MITQVKVSHKYINISIAIVNEEGNAIDPINAEAYFYKISQIDGSLSLDTNIGGTGIVNLLKQNGQTGFYGNFVNIESFLEAEYIILYKVYFPVITTITVESISIDLSKKIIGEIKLETDKIQPEIIDKKDEYKADVSVLALDATVAKETQATINKDAIITEIDINEVKIDAVKIDTESIISTLSTLVVEIAVAVWTYVTRTITAGGITAAEIWSYITRTLTSGTKDAEIDAIKIQTDKIPNIKTETDKIKKILGLVQQNFKLSDLVYDGDNLISTKIKIYTDSTLNTLITQYQMTATFSEEGKCINYQVKEV